MKPISLPLLAMAGISFYVGIYHLVIYLQRRKHREDLTFALLCFAVLLYDLSGAFGYSSTDTLQGAIWLRRQWFMVAVIGMAFLCFLYDYTRRKLDRLGYILLALFGIAAIVQAVDRSYLTFITDVPVVKEVLLPGGGLVTYYEVANGPFTILQAAAGILVIMYFLWLAIRYYWQGDDRRKATSLLLSMTIMNVAMISDLLVSLGVYPFIYLTEYGFLAYIILMALSLSETVVKAAMTRDALRASEERFRSLVETINDFVWEVDQNGVYTYASPNVSELIGYTPGEMIGKTPFDFMPPEEGRLVAAVFQEAAAHLRPVERLENTVRHKDGRNVILETSGMPYLDEDGGLLGYRGIDRNITQRKQAEQALTHHLAELEALHTVSVVMRTAQTRSEALSILLDETLAALRTDTGIIWLYDPEDNLLHANSARGWFQQISEPGMKPGEGIAGTVFTSGQVYISPEFRSDPLTRVTVRDKVPSNWGGVCLPIRTGDITIGVLFVAMSYTHEIAADQVNLLESLAEMAGAALHRMSLHEETRRQLDQLQALHRIDQAISASTDLHMTLDVLLEHVTTQLKVDAADVLLLNPYSLVLTYAAGTGFRTRAAESAHVRLGDGYAGRVALEHHIIQLDGAAQMNAVPQFAALWAGEEFTAYYAVPLIVKGQAKGVLELFHRAPLVIEREWVSFLEMLAGQAAIAIENAQLFDHLQRSNVDLALAYDATIEGWARALDLRDKETEGHTQRVTELTEQLARAMGISEAEIVHIRRGALLHDIGKMGVPDSILLKSDELTDEEWVSMRQHPQYAFDMLAPISFLRPALDIPYCHHEKWDGTGYPRGLKGDQIPLAARLFIVVDVCDALRSNRYYREAWSEEKVLEHIKSGSGAHFDPQVVDLFLKVMSEKNG